MLLTGLTHYPRPRAINPANGNGYFVPFRRAMISSL